MDRVLQGDDRRRISRIARAKTGVEFVDYGEVGFRHILAKRKVANLEELKGLKIRMPEIQAVDRFLEKAWRQSDAAGLRGAVQRAIDRIDRRT